MKNNDLLINFKQHDFNKVYHIMNYIRKTDEFYRLEEDINSERCFDLK